MPGINKSTFYSKKPQSDTTSDTSTNRWAGKRKYVSSTVIPPSEPAASSSGCLSLPSGMSPPRGSPSTSPESSLVHSFAKPVIATRFTNALIRNNKLTSLCPTLSSIPSQTISPLKRCKSWLQTDLGKVSDAASSTKPLVDYSPSSSASSSCQSASEKQAPASLVHSSSKTVFATRLANVTNPYRARRVLFNESSGKLITINSIVQPKRAKLLDKNNLECPSNMSTTLKDIDGCKSNTKLLDRNNCSNTDEVPSLTDMTDRAISSQHTLPGDKSTLDVSSSENQSTPDAESGIDRASNNSFELEKESTPASEDKSSSFSQVPCNSEKNKKQDTVDVKKPMRTRLGTRTQSSNGKSHPDLRVKSGFTGSIRCKKISSACKQKPTDIDGCKSNTKLLDRNNCSNTVNVPSLTDLTDRAISSQHTLPGDKSTLDVSSSDNHSNTPDAESGIDRASNNSFELEKESTPASEDKSGCFSKVPCNSEKKKKKDTVSDRKAMRTIRSRNGERISYFEADLSDEGPSLFADVPSDDIEIEGLDSSESETENIIPMRQTLARQQTLELAEMDDSDEDRHTIPQKKQRKRKQNVICSKEQKEKNKYLRNTGQEYHTIKGKKVAARKQKPPHKCKRNKCQDIISKEVGDSIFNEYWEQGSHDKRVAYIAARVETFTTRTDRRRLPRDHENSHPKSVAHKFFFNIHGVSRRVCKETFLGTLGETDGFLRFAVKNKVASVSGIVKDDKRGKHKPKHTLKSSVVEEVTSHILRFPSYRSHYKRAEVGDTRYLPSHLNRKIMHNLYLEEGYTPVSYSTYERIFNTTGREFKKPPTDSCGKCDEFDQKLKNIMDETEREELEKNYDAHLVRAQAGYDFKKKCKLDAESDPSIRVLVFDLEQVLQTPLLTAGKMFYSRQLSTYNLTIYDTSSKVTHSYMWCEIDGKRGSNEIASCMFYHFLDVVPDTVKKVYIFSDSTSGQNRNSILAAMFLTVLQVHQSVSSIEHVFLEVGHTRLEVDCKHSVIEGRKAYANKISTPNDWYNVVRSLGAPSKHFPNGRFAVTEMKGNIYDFKSLLTGPLVKRTKSVTKEKFNWFATPLLRYDRSKPGKVFYKKKHSDKGYCCVDFQRRGKAGEYAAQNLFRTLKLCYPEPLPISKEKKKDLLGLLNLLPKEAHEFYQSIPVHDLPALSERLPDESESESDCEEDDDSD